MSTELLQSIADSNLWWAIGPEMILACAALGLLVIEIATPKEQHRFIPHVAIASLVIVLLAVIVIILRAGLPALNWTFLTSASSLAQEGGGIDAQGSSPMLVGDYFIGNSKDGVFSFAGNS